MSKNQFRGFIALLIAIVLVAGVCCVGFVSRNDEGKWFGNFKNTSEWHWEDKVTDDDGEDKDNDNGDGDQSGDDNGDDSDVTDSGEDIEVSFNENNVIRMSSKRVMAAEYEDYGISSQADSVTIISVVTPNENLTYHWSLSSGGTTYVSLSTTTGTSVTVSAKQAFANQITLTCTAKYGDDEVTTATCSIDYRKRLGSIKINNTTITAGSTVNLKTLTGKETFKEALKTTDLSFTAATGVGSTGGTYGIYSIRADEYDFTKFSTDMSGKPFNLTFAEFFYCGWTGERNESNISQMRNGTYAATEFLYQMGVANTTWTVTLICGLYGDSASYENFSFNVLFPSGWQPSTYSLELSESNIVL